MLRLAVARSNLCLEQGAQRALRRQWQTRRTAQPLTRSFAAAKTPDQIVLPGTQTGTVAGVPQPPILEATPATPTTAAAQPTPRVPPTPAEVNATPPKPSTVTGNLPPTGTGTAATGPTSAPPPPPPRRRRRFRNFLLSLIVLSSLGYAGGVYYSLVNDNFHDFFTEYVPGGEDAVAYFEEREFRKRFPPRDATGAAGGKNWPQTRGENKITIGRSSGVNPRLAVDANPGSDLGQKGRHVSAVGDNGVKPAAAPAKKDAPAPGAAPASTSAKTDPTKPEVSPKAAEKPVEKKSAAAPTAPLIDHVNVPEATEPVVQDLVKILNNIITAVNASPEAGKYSSTLQTAKSDLNGAIGQIKLLKDSTSQDAETKIKDAHAEFDQAAKELVRRLESEMHDQELRWREEYENEREKLSTSYQQKLAAELDSAKKVAAEANKNALLEQEIALQKAFLDNVQSKIEQERDGRLSKLDSLSASVGSLEELTGKWNTVVDATLSTQHLQVALAAVRARLAATAEPTPFVDELVALKEVSGGNAVVDAAIASIPPIAYQRGLPSPAALIDRFRRVAAEVRKAALLPADAGVASHAASAVLSRLLFAKRSARGLPEGDDVEATLARTEALLEEGDLDAAAREMNGLAGWAGVLSRDWVSECRRVLEVQQAVEVIATEARLQSLLVE